ncbi:hypothetical protein [Microbacterium sp. SORGH_AS_0421]|uniref:hypothetical protein n=1 Tax=Microbacterium sp. SORGH_AS_0421 TaxID=3041768 RepID=UPI00278F9313|nr:hypothetical protein [Microbacterium sp. SORGH_AS_0421]MDQ1177192.1 hypothetical protein [Microbacterium sp. SORGH_AS_0421]
MAQLVPDEECAQGQADREQCGDDDRARARGEADEREGAGKEQQRAGEDDEAAQIEVPCAARTLGLRDAQPDGDADEGDDDGGDRERELQVAAARGEEAAGGEGAGPVWDGRRGPFRIGVLRSLVNVEKWARRRVEKVVSGRWWCATTVRTGARRGGRVSVLGRWR